LGGRGRRISEFKVKLVYRVSSRTARATQRNPVSIKKKKEEEDKRKRCLLDENRALAYSHLSQSTHKEGAERPEVTAHTCLHGW
jgi:hypothetical protein